MSTPVGFCDLPRNVFTELFQKLSPQTMARLACTKKQFLDIFHKNIVQPIAFSPPTFLSIGPIHSIHQGIDQGLLLSNEEKELYSARLSEIRKPKLLWSNLEDPPLFARFLKEPTSIRWITQSGSTVERRLEEGSFTSIEYEAPNPILGADARQIDFFTLSSDGSRAFLASRQGDFEVWDIKSNTCESKDHLGIEILSIHPVEPHDVIVALKEPEGSIALYRLTENTPPTLLWVEENFGNAPIDVDAAGTGAILGFPEGHIELWSLIEKCRKVALISPSLAPITAIRFSSTPFQGFVCRMDGSIQIFSIL